MSKHVGRHRAPGYSPMQEISQIATENARPAFQASAAAVITTGMVAVFGVPAVSQAAPVAAGVQSSDGVAAPAEEIELGPVVVAPAQTTKVPTFGSLAGFQAAPAAVDASRSSRSSTRTTTQTSSNSNGSNGKPVNVEIPAANNSITSVARSLLGIPYRYGGMSTSGTDCSGFTSMVYKAATGRILPRTAEGQRQGAVKISNPQPGDLVFFGIPASHVGIYAGNGMMYDASKPGTVTSYRKIYSYKTITYGRY